MSKLKALEEFVVGKHGIGWVDSDFKSRFKDVEFDKVSGTPAFQKLPRRMNDAEIESELKPGICTLGDVLAFLENAPEETKDGYWNLFYTEAFVVDVYWRGDEWGVDAWQRGDGRWYDDSRVFSPATGRSVSCHSCHTCALELRLSELEDWKKKVEKVLTV